MRMIALRSLRRKNTLCAQRARENLHSELMRASNASSRFTIANASRVTMNRHTRSQHPVTTRERRDAHIVHATSETKMFRMRIFFRDPLFEITKWSYAS